MTYMVERLAELQKVIEHNLDVIKTAGWVIDLGPPPAESWPKVRRSRCGR